MGEISHTRNCHPDQGANLAHKVGFLVDFDVHVREFGQQTPSRGTGQSSADNAVVPSVLLLVLHVRGDPRNSQLAPGQRRSGSIDVSPVGRHGFCSSVCCADERGHEKRLELRCFGTRSGVNPMPGRKSYNPRRRGGATCGLSTVDGGDMA
jgi:hypothetical protein